MKQIIKPTGTPAETHLATGGKGRSANQQTSSLDDLSEKYLIGQWPREPYQSRPSCMSDKATQTPGVWSDDGPEVKTHKRSASWNSADHLTEISKLRQQLQFSLRGSRSMKERKVSGVSLTSLNQSKHLSASSCNTTQPTHVTHLTQSQPLSSRMSSYTDCINQELENAFICENWGRKAEKALEVRDGGRAPVPPPHHSQISSPAPDPEKDCRSSPDLQLACSPKPNNSYMFKREPPEGCEKVKVFGDVVSCRTQAFPIFSCPDRNKVNFCPSGSAFCPVKLLCSSLFPAEHSGSSENQTQGQTSGSFKEATIQNNFNPSPSEHCSIRKCLLLS